MKTVSVVGAWPQSIKAAMVSGRTGGMTAGRGERSSSFAV